MLYRRDKHHEIELDNLWPFSSRLENNLSFNVKGHVWEFLINGIISDLLLLFLLISFWGSPTPGKIRTVRSLVVWSDCWKAPVFSITGAQPLSCFHLKPSRTEFLMVVWGRPLPPHCNSWGQSKHLRMNYIRELQAERNEQSTFLFHTHLDPHDFSSQEDHVTYCFVLINIEHW